MQRSARTAQTILPFTSGSSTMQPATGQAAWQIEHANAPKQRSGSMTAIVFGAFLRGPDIILVHMDRNYSVNYLYGWPVAGVPISGIPAARLALSSKIVALALVAKNRKLVGSVGSALALNACAAAPTPSPLQV